MDSTKKKTAISGIRMDTAISLCLNSLTDNVISMISQARLRRGTNTNRKRRRVYPELVWLNPKSKSNLPPIKRIIGSWVKKTAMPRKIISFTPYGSDNSKVCPKLFSVSHQQFYCYPFRSFHCLDFVRSFSKKYRDKPRITASPICPSPMM